MKKGRITSITDIIQVAKVSERKGYDNKIKSVPIFQLAFIYC